MAASKSSFSLISPGSRAANADGTIDPQLYNNLLSLARFAGVGDRPATVLSFDNSGSYVPECVAADSGFVYTASTMGSLAIAYGYTVFIKPPPGGHDWLFVSNGGVFRLYPNWQIKTARTDVGTYPGPVFWYPLF